MKDSFAFYAILLAAYGAFVVGTAIWDVGTPIVCKVEEYYTWSLPFAMFGVIAIPAALGFLAGLRYRSEL